MKRSLEFDFDRFGGWAVKAGVDGLRETVRFIYKIDKNTTYDY